MWPLYKNVGKMDDAEMNFGHPYLVLFFVKWLFDPSQPSKSPQNNGRKSETKIVKITHSAAMHLK